MRCPISRRRCGRRDGLRPIDVESERGDRYTCAVTPDLSRDPAFGQRMDKRLNASRSLDFGTMTG